MKTRASLWGHYLLLMAVEEAFKNLKGDLAVRPVFHQLEARIVSTIFATTVRRSRKGAREHSRARRRIGARSFTRIVPLKPPLQGVCDHQALVSQTGVGLLQPQRPE